jgi:transcriptional regulator with XRE-family HTH domain
MTLADRLRARRKSADLTQVELAERAGVSQSVVSRLESGTTTEASWSVMAAIAKALGATPEELLEGSAPATADGSEPREYTIVPSHDGRRVPVLRNLPNWEELVAAARVLDSRLPPWVFEELGGKSPFLAGQLTASAVRDLGRVILKHSAPPKGSK